MDAIKKAMYLGLGAISLTKDKAEMLIDDLVKRGEVNEKDRGKMLQKLLKEGESQKNELEGKIASSVEKAVTGMGLPTQKDFNNILKRLEGIEKAIGTPANVKEGPAA
jgi:polyhydroxyalkanoate synthesis regulator phasin